MQFGEAIVFYLLMGGAVATATYAYSPPKQVGAALFTALAATLFWPLYLPLLLSKPSRTTSTESPANATDLNDAITCVASELTMAAPAASDLSERVRESLEREASRIAEMQSLLQAETAAPRAMPKSSNTQQRASEAARLANRAQLAALREASRAALGVRIARIRELISELQLARFSDAPRSQVDKLLTQIEAIADHTANALAEHTVN